MTNSAGLLTATTLETAESHIKLHQTKSSKQERNRCVFERRWTLFLFSFLSTSSVAGVIYGWPALRQELIQEGSSLSEAQLGALYTAGCFSATVCRFFWGLARDRYGTRLVACASLGLTCVGALGIALADASNGATLAFSLVVLSCCAGTHLVAQPVAKLFPVYSSTIVSSLTGAFQISGLVFLCLTSLPISRKNTFLGYAIFVAGLGVFSWYILPKSKFYDVLPDLELECAEPFEETGLATVDICQEPDNKTEPRNDESGLLSLKHQLISSEYIALLVWFSVSLIPMQYYIGSIGFQLEDKGDTNGFYARLFSVIYASAAIVAPFGGYLSDVIGLGLTQGLSTVLTAASFFILANDRFPLSIHVVGLVIYSVGRMFVIGTFLSNLGKRFGYSNFGILSGLGLLISGAISILQYPLIAAASDGYAWSVNIISGSLLLCMTPYCMWLSIVENKDALQRT